MEIQDMANGDSSKVVQQLDTVLQQLEKQMKMKEGVENMLEVYQTTDHKHRKRIKELEVNLDVYSRNIIELTKMAENIRHNSGSNAAEITRKLKETKFFNVPTPFGLTSSAAVFTPPGRARRAKRARSFSSGDKRQQQRDESASEEAQNEAEVDQRSLSERLSDILFILTQRGQPDLAKINALSALIKIADNTTTGGLESSELLHSIRACSTASNRELRVNALRAVRHLILNDTSCQFTLHNFLPMHLDLVVIRAITRDPAYHSEREQALKLIRTLMDYSHGGTVYITQGILRAVVAIAEQMDDTLRNIALETLAEMAICDLPSFVQVGGLRVIVQAVIDGPRRMIDVLVSIIVYVLDDPSTRVYIRPGIDLQFILASFTDAYSKGPSAEERLRNSVRVLTLLFKTWTGTLFLCSNESRAIHSVVEALRLPYEETTKILLDMLFEIFRIPLPKDSTSYFTSHRPGNWAGTPGVDDSLELSTTYKHKQIPTLLHHHLSLILNIFTDAGIMMALVDIIKKENLSISRKATHLMGEMLQLSTRILPVGIATQIQSLPKLFVLAASFENEEIRHNATAVLSHIDNLNRIRGRLQSQVIIEKEESSRRNQEKVREVKVRLGMQIDDVHFRTMLVDSQVLNTKDHNKWNWEVITELLQGPLLNPRRLEEATRGCKFVKRLLAFYRPFRHRFSDLKASKVNHNRYDKAGCALFHVLLANAEGVRYLAENKILRQLADAFSQLDPMNASSESEQIFTRERMDSTLTSSYFRFLGVFSKHREGLNLLERFRIFSLLYAMSEFRSRDDLIMALITNFDYTLDGHPRVLLSKMMTSGYKHIRLFATTHLGEILSADGNEFNDWAIRLLITQLYDPYLEVCQKAVSVLDDACVNVANLELLVRLRPSLDHLGEISNPLLLKFLSTSSGFTYLNGLDYVSREMDEWYKERNCHYVTQLEVSLARAIMSSPEGQHSVFEERVDNKHNFETVQPCDGAVPSHFYGELTKTPQGCLMLREAGHFSLFADYIRNYSMESHDREIIRNLKAVLWAVGNIGATRNGLPFLEEEDIVKDIVAIAEHSEVLSLKGTSYYVLGLICRTQQGVELLGEFGWEGVVYPNGEVAGLCVPANLRPFLIIPPWKYAGIPAPLPRIELPISTQNRQECDVLKAIGDMSNQILASAASKDLTQLKSKNPSLFANIHMLSGAFELIGGLHYRLPVRRYILDMFDVDMNDEAYEWLDRIRNGSSSNDVSVADSEQAATTDGTEEGVMNGAPTSTKPDLPRLVRYQRKDSYNIRRSSHGYSGGSGPRLKPMIASLSNSEGGYKSDDDDQEGSELTAVKAINPVRHHGFDVAA
ncbi:hypothetical protein BZG36_04577 [Bifiguratus adelaidae]|uniref:REM-1 domain-containing protein n=1 Tax=Bifiguratus adelaidae TaxID=1938954 RepID=A0A261XUU2_9FUNG|nr:hypothetical protein BZG36_04577 [Bifiguratus adelaidae]